MENNLIKFDHIQGTISKPYRLFSNVGFFWQIGWRRILYCGALQLLARHRPVCTCILCLFVFVFVFLYFRVIPTCIYIVGPCRSQRDTDLSRFLQRWLTQPVSLCICILCFLYLYFCIIPICICIHLCILKQATDLSCLTFPSVDSPPGLLFRGLWLDLIALSIPIPSIHFDTRSGLADTQTFQFNSISLFVELLAQILATTCNRWFWQLSYVLNRPRGSSRVKHTSELPCGAI